MWTSLLRHVPICPCSGQKLKSGFPNIIWKTYHWIHFTLDVHTCWVSVENRLVLVHVSRILDTFFSGQKDWNWRFPIIIWKANYSIIIKLFCTIDGRVFRIDSLLHHPGSIWNPLVARIWLKHGFFSWPWVLITQSISSMVYTLVH